MIRLATLAAAALVGSAAIAAAAPITQTYSIVAAGFTAMVNGSPVPVDPVYASFTITFDPSADAIDVTSGVVVNELNLSVPDIAYTYAQGPDLLVIGGLLAGAGALEGGTSDFALLIYNPAGEWSAGAAYYTVTEVNDVFTTANVVTPEPATAAVLGIGLLGLAGLRRRG